MFQRVRLMIIGGRAYLVCRTQGECRSPST